MDIVSATGEVAFETLVRALARNEQEHLAKRLDDELADRFVKKAANSCGCVVIFASRWSIAVVRVCLSVCLSVCSHGQRSGLGLGLQNIFLFFPISVLAAF